MIISGKAHCWSGATVSGIIIRWCLLVVAMQKALLYQVTVKLVESEVDVSKVVAVFEIQFDFKFRIPVDYL